MRSIVKTSAAENGKDERNSVSTGAPEDIKFAKVRTNLENPSTENSKKMTLLTS